MGLLPTGTGSGIFFRLYQMKRLSGIAHWLPSAWRQTTAAGLLAGALLLPVQASAQELNATVTVNAQQIEASARERFASLKETLEEFINGQQWTGTQFAHNERIECTFAVTVNEIAATDVYNVSLTVQARRPVFNASYQTTLINWRDDSVVFPYQDGQNLTYNEFNLDNELIATLAYYCYLIIGLDFESFGPQGGEQYLRKCESIVSQMQTSDNRGWKAFDAKTNRHALITALLEQSQQPYRQLWYTYHRMGLDQMAQSVDKGRTQITAALPQLSEVRQADAMTPLLSLFIAAKQDELCNIYSEAPMTEKKQMYELLTDIYPTYTKQLAPIKEEYRE